MAIGMLKTKKGLFFTILTVLFLSIFLFYFTIGNLKRYSNQMVVIESRVNSMNDFVKSIERDVERGLYISSFRALLSISVYLANKDSFITNINGSFSEAVLNGTINQEVLPLMVNSTLNDWINSIKSQGGNLNLIVNINVSQLKVYQKDPWRVYSSINVTIDIIDSSALASWHRERLVETSVSILGLEDPLYIVNGHRRLTNLINITPYEGVYTSFVIGVWNVSKLLAHANQSFYTSNTNAPDYLARFENKTDASAYGIESMVDVIELSSQGLPITDKSIIDYIYWSNLTTSDYHVNFTPSWFKIDQQHCEKYQVKDMIRCP